MKQLLMKFISCKLRQEDQLKGPSKDVNELETFSVQHPSQWATPGADRYKHQPFTASPQIPNTRNEILLAGH